MKILKYIVFALMAFVLLVGAVLGYVAATFNPNQYKPQIVQAVKEKTRRTLRLDGDIGLSLWPDIGAKIGKASLSERDGDREFAAVEEVRVALKLMPLLSGRAIVDTVRVKGLHANIVKGRDGKTNVDDLAGPAVPKDAPAAKDVKTDFVLDVAGVEIMDAAVTYADQAAGARYVLSKLNLKTGRIAPGVPTPLDFSMHAQGDRPKLDLPVTLKTRLTLDAAKQTLALDDLVIDMKGAAAGLSNLAVRLAGSAAVDNAQKQVRATLSGKLADSNIKAQIEVAGFAAPAIHFDVDLDRLDLDSYLSKAGDGGQAAGPPKQAQAGKEAPFDLTGLRSLKADGRLRIGAFKANNVKASDVSANLKAQGGRLDISPLHAGFYQGKLASTIAINAAPAVPVFSIRHNMSGISVGPLLKDLADNDMLEGKGDVTLDVTTQGNTVSSMKRALGGSAALKLADGALKGIDIAGSIRSAKAKLGALRGEHAQAADKSQKTDFSELTATFAIRNGVAHNNDLSLKSPLLRVGGEGDINIGEDTLNYLVKASIVGTAKGQGGRETDELHGVTIPVRVTGPLTAPSYKIDFNALVTDSAKQRLTDELQKRFGGGAAAGDATKKDGAPSGGSTRDRLRGLFGR